MSRFPRPRRIVFWMHLVAGLTAGLVILVMAATGLLISFERQITEAADGFHLSPPAADTPRLAMEALHAKLRAAEPGARPTGFLLNAEPAGAAGFQFGKDRTVFINPWTGEVLGEGAVGTRAIFKQVTALHRWLALTGEAKDVGQAITSAAALGFLFILLSGLFLWFPKVWSRAALKAIATLRPGLKGRARDWNWHNALGIWALLPLLLTVGTGLIMAYPWANTLLFNAVGESPPPRKAPPGGGAGAAGDGMAGGKGKSVGASTEGSGRSAETKGPETLPSGLDAALAAAISSSPGWRQIQFSFPAGNGPMTLFVADSHRGRPDLRREISFDPVKGGILDVKEFASQSKGRQLRAWVRWLHTGEALGWIGQTISALASAAVLVLIWTGFSLSWRRFSRRRRVADGEP